MRATGSRIILLVCLAAITAPATAGPSRVSAKKPTVKYSAYGAANAQQAGCLGRTGLYVGLQGPTSSRLPRSQLRKLVKANTPRKATALVGKKSYPLQINQARSAYGNGQVGWSFKPVRLGKQAARKLIGSRLTLRYRLPARPTVTKVVRIVDGACHSLI